MIETPIRLLKKLYFSLRWLSNQKAVQGFTVGCFFLLLIFAWLFQEVKIAVVVLGGGLTSDGEVPAHTQLRLNKAVELYRLLPNATTIITLSGGTVHKPNPLDSEGFPIWEATASAKKLIQMGIPSRHIMEEAFSLDTIGNAYFLRSIHILPGFYTKMHVITNSWHMERTKAIFNMIFSLDVQKTSKLRSHPIEIVYESVDDVLTGAALDSRIKRETESLKFFIDKIQSKRFHHLENFYEWMFTEHMAYSSSRLLVPRKDNLKTSMHPKRNTILKIGVWREISYGYFEKWKHLLYMREARGTSNRRTIPQN
eukprot:gene7796-15946_t